MPTLTRLQTAYYTLPNSTVVYTTIEPRPVIDRFSSKLYHNTQCTDKEGNIIKWFHNGIVKKRFPDGRQMWWDEVPTMKTIIEKHNNEELYVRFYSKGSIELVDNYANVKIYYGPVDTVVPDIEGTYTYFFCGCDDEHGLDMYYDDSSQEYEPYEEYEDYDRYEY